MSSPACSLCHQVGTPGKAEYWSYWDPPDYDDEDSYESSSDGSTHKTRDHSKPGLCLNAVGTPMPCCVINMATWAKVYATLATLAFAWTAAVVFQVCTTYNT